MKRSDIVLKNIFTLISCVFFLLPAKAVQQETGTVAGMLVYMDSVEFSLITCSPHEEIYSLYGHTALRRHDLHQSDRGDVVFNWGVFNFKKRFFVARFVFGLTDYELGLGDFQLFCNYYKRWGSSVTEQVLNLTAEEKLALDRALAENYKEENRIYRYNFFYDNCSTRPRDMIEQCIKGRVVYESRQDFEPSYREMVREKTKKHEWATFGNDMLLGLKADFKTSRQEQEFLPEHLLYDFDYAKIQGSDGSWRSLVKERRMPVRPGVQIVERDFLLSPMECAVILLVVSLGIFALEWKCRKTFKYWDAALMLLTGLAGCVLFVMIFSQHPATSINLQILLVNPIHLFYLPSVLRRRKMQHYWQMLLAMICLFYIGAIWQHSAEGMSVLALCLLLRYWSHYKNEK